MAVNDDTFSMSTMFDALPYPNGVSGSIPPPGFAPHASSATHLHAAMFSLMTSCEGLSYFKETISTLDKAELQRMASLLTSDSDYFMAIVTNKNGSKRVQKLLGISDDLDALFCAAILRRFLHITADKYASYVTIRAMTVFEEEKKKAMYEHILHHALDLACDQHGCIALNDIITDADDPYYRNQILDLVAYNALRLSNHASGNFVVQHVLTLFDSRSIHNIAVSLRGHCIDLSFKKYGSYIMEKLLEAEESIAVVVVELLECEGGRLMRLGRNEFGSFVVCKALRMTKEMSRMDLFWRLVEKLMPFVHLLRRSHGNNIANILESLKLRC